MMDGMKRRRGHLSKQKAVLRPTILVPLILGVALFTMIMLVRMQAPLLIGNNNVNSNSLAADTKSRAKEEVKERTEAEKSFESSVKSTGIATGITKTITFVECKVTTPMANSADTSVANGVLQITVRNDLSPIASKVFVDLVNAHYYDGVFIFRVLKGFVAQWGFHNKWTKTTKPPKTKDAVHENTLSNLRGTLSFAGGNPAVQQVFVNLGNNARLDKEDSRPFATLSQESMDIVDELYMEYKDGQGQIKALQKEGVNAVLEIFPKMSKVESCHTVSAFST